MNAALCIGLPGTQGQGAQKSAAAVSMPLKKRRFAQILFIAEHMMGKSIHLQFHYIGRGATCEKAESSVFLDLIEDEGLKPLWCGDKKSCIN